MQQMNDVYGIPTSVKRSQIVKTAGSDVNPFFVMNNRSNIHAQSPKKTLNMAKKGADLRLNLNALNQSKAYPNHKATHSNNTSMINQSSLYI